MPTRTEADFDNPMDCDPGDRVELFETLFPMTAPFFGTVEGYVSSILYVALDSNPSWPIPVSTFTRWRRVVELAVATQRSPAVRAAGAWCTGKHCPTGYFEYAEQTDDFKCYSCKRR